MISEINELIKSITSSEYDSNSGDFVVDGMEINITVSSKKCKDFLRGVYGLL